MKVRDSKNHANDLGRDKKTIINNYIFGLAQQSLNQKALTIVFQINS